MPSSVFYLFIFYFLNDYVHLDPGISRPAKFEHCFHARIKYQFEVSECDHENYYGHTKLMLTESTAVWQASMLHASVCTEVHFKVWKEILGWHREKIPL